MQVTRPNEIRKRGVRLHLKACADLRLEVTTYPKAQGMHGIEV